MSPYDRLRTTNSKPELMAPAGNKTMLAAVIKAGADAVYFGVDTLNMRANATNFKVEDLPELVSFCKNKGVRTYLTLNTIVYQDEIDQLKLIIDSSKKAGIDSIICWDFSVVQLCKEIGMSFSISTQSSVSNSLAAKFYEDMGAKRIVLARECTLEDIKKIRKLTNLEIEVFIHGAMCIAVSGRCFMSHHLFNKSANRGECIQPCRREYEVYDPIINKGMVIGEDYVLSPQDLCTIDFIDQIIEAGVDSLKIEGRKRSPEYAATATASYRKAIDLHFDKKLTSIVKKELLTELERVFNRGFSSGFYLKEPGEDEYSDSFGSKATQRKEYLGKVLNYYKKAGIAYIAVEAGELKQGDEIYIIGETTGVVQLNVENIMNEQDKVTSASQGDKITFRCNELVRARDAVYLIRNQEEQN